VSLPKPIRATGRRKSAVAQITMTSGRGDFQINSQPATDYLRNDAFLLNAVQAPLETIALQESFDINVKVIGGGIVGQAFAIRLGIARALNLLNPPSRALLKQRGFLTRDARVKERKKYGLKKARKASQFSKR
jgi:small subunit ribosomal protein S9